MSDLSTIIEHFPLAVDCLKGHIGDPVESLTEELADDRYYEIKITRCGHCGIPLREEYV